VGGANAICSSQGQELMRSLDGSWRGRGAVTPIGGAPERVNCRVNYSTEGASRINQVVACAGTDYKIEASSRVSCVGNRLEGSFQEKIANNTGRVTGDISSERLNIELDGPSFKGRFNVVFQGDSKHSVSITQFDPGKGRHVPVASMQLSR
jgi:hypothetical protein